VQEEGEDVAAGGEHSGGSRRCGQAGEFRGCSDPAAEGVGELHEGDGGDAEGVRDCQGPVRTTEYYSTEREPAIFQPGSWWTTKQQQFQTTCAECTGSRWLSWSETSPAELCTKRVHTVFQMQTVGHIAPIVQTIRLWLQQRQ